jgi:helix-turn-helix domain of resolvase
MVMILQSWLDYGAAVVFISQTNLQEDFGSLFAHPISIQVDSGKSDKFHYQYKGEGKGSFTCRISRTAKGDKLVKEQKHPAKKRNRRSEAEHAQLRLEVARLSESGMKIGDIATELNISRSSVNKYLEKLGRTRKRVTRDVVY